MSQIIRPEAKAFLARWSDLLVALALLLLGLWWLVTSGGVVRAFGGALAALAVVLAWSAVQRRRFATGDEDPGLVDVVEGQISYFSPAGGGFASLSELVELRLTRSGPRRAWVLISRGWPDLVIPVGASGSEKLFDAFCALPGLSGATLVAALAEEGGRPAGPGLPGPVTALPQSKTVWTRPALRVLH